MAKTMTKDEWYGVVAKAKDDGYTREDCLNMVLDAVVEGNATIRELFRYAKWIDLTADKKEIKRIVKEERTKRKQEKEQEHGNGKD